MKKNILILTAMVSTWNLVNPALICPITRAIFGVYMHASKYTGAIASYIFKYLNETKCT